MKFRNFGQASLAILATLAASLGVTACKQNYTVGYLYTVGSVTGTHAGEIGAFKINSTNGALFTIPGQPFSSGGSNPIREVVENSGHYVYVLNQGTSSTGSNGNVTYSPDAGISVFSVGGDGALSFQQYYGTSGYGAQRLVEFSGSYLYELDEYAPAFLPGTQTLANASSAYSSSFPCKGSDGYYHPVGALTAYQVNGSTGILTLVQNVQQQGITYFPVGCFPVDMHIAGGYIYTMDAGSTTNNDVETVFPYLVNSTTGQLTTTQNGPLVTNATNVTFIGGDAAGSYVYLLDAGTNEIFAYTPGSNGALNAISGSPFANDPTTAGMSALLVDSSNQYLYIANAQPASGLKSSSGLISYFTINPTSKALAEDAGSPIGTGSGPDCIVEDPSNQYIYTSDYNSGTVTGRLFDPHTGTLTDLRANSSITTVGNPTWCVIDSHTD